MTTKKKSIIASYYGTGYKRIKNEFLDSDFPKRAGCNHWGISIVISLESFVETSLSLTTRFTTSTISIGTIFTRATSAFNDIFLIYPIISDQ
ncbi:uncharacterized protein OCT59_022651 [Rhizophagus irregularis]|uniref:uncharacterized protein n=1 Tax=Rhizophagus irregularis TaxID=588596 RepID=UPI00332E056A|nr:hypothetical protein OCT59_022651 [Rhizophagus irregularis]